MSQNKLNTAPNSQPVALGVFSRVPLWYRIGSNKECLMRKNVYLVEINILKKIKFVQMKFVYGWDELIIKRDHNILSSKSSKLPFNMP